MCWSRLRRKRVFLVGLVALRVLLAALALQTTGIVHVVADAIALARGEAHDDDDCRRETGPRDCPPGCPSCHCAPGAFAALPPVATSTAIASAARAPTPPARLTDDAPPTTDPRPHFRPPKRAAAVA